MDGPEKTILIDAELMETQVTQMTELLKGNRKEFTWSLAYILSLNPGVVVHKLNIDYIVKRVLQKKRMFTSKRQKAIAKEVKKLKTTDFIREV